jgi:hypothetical protein
MKSAVETYYAVRSECRDGSYLETRNRPTLKAALEDAKRFPEPNDPKQWIVVRTSTVTNYLSWDEWCNLEVEGTRDDSQDDSLTE